MRTIIKVFLLCLLKAQAVDASIFQAKKDTLIASKQYLLGDSLQRLAKYNESTKYFQKAHDLYKRQNDQEKFIKCKNEICENLWQSSQYDKALELALEIIVECKETINDNLIGEADGYNNLGIIYDLRGNHELAIQSHMQSLTIKKKLFGEVLTTANTYNNLGMVYHNKGELDKALQYFQRALVVKVRLLGESHPETILAKSNIGMAYDGRGEYDKALDFYSQALHQWEQKFGEQHPYTVLMLSNVGNVYISKGYYELAINSFMKAIEIQKKLSINDVYNFVYLYSNLGIVYHRIKKYELALSYLTKALESATVLFGAHHPFVANIYADIGDVYASKDQYETSLLFYQKGINAVIIRATAHLNSKNYLSNTAFLRLLINRGETYYSIYQKDKDKDYLYNSLNDYQVSDSITHQLQLSYLTRDDKVRSRNFTKQLYEGAIKVSLKIYENSLDTIYLKKAFYFSERSRARVLAEALSASEAKQFGKVSDSLVTLETSLKADRSFYQSQLTSADSDLYQNKLFMLNQRYDSLMQMLEAQFPDYYQLKYAARTATVLDIQSQLSPDEAVVSYFIGDSTQYAFTITATQFQVTTLPQDSLLDQRVQTLRQAVNLDSTLRTAYQRQAYALYQQLLAPVIADSLLTGIRRLTIIPDGALGYLPFELLLTQPASADTEYAALPYLMRDYTVRYGYSATWLFHPFSRSARPAQDQYIAFAPNYPTSVSDTTQQLALGRFRDQVSSLRFNGQEANNIQQYLSGVTLTDKEAVERRFKQEANQYRIIHLAMHALVDDENPMYSRLVFTPDATDTLEDGYLNAYELYNMELSAELAVLSACETGYGKLEQGEGIMSLARAFAYAGCPSIVMSHWTVEDAASAQLMNHFYRYLSEGLPKDEALRQAKLAYLETASLQDTHPFFWGNFVVIGDTAPIVVPRPVWQYWLIGGGFLLAVGLVILFLQRYLFGRRYHKGA